MADIPVASMWIAQEQHTHPALGIDLLQSDRGSISFVGF